MAQINLLNLPNTVDDPINRECHDICIKLFKQLTNKELALPEFLQEVAYTALKYDFDKIVPHDYPLKIKEIVEYENLGLMEKNKISSEYWRLPQIVNYLDTYRRTKSWNKNTKEWLEEIATYIPQEDYPSQVKIRNRLKEFTNPMVANAMKTFEAQEIDNDYSG